MERYVTCNKCKGVGSKPAKQVKIDRFQLPIKMELCDKCHGDGVIDIYEEAKSIRASYRREGYGACLGWIVVLIGMLLFFTGQLGIGIAVAALGFIIFTFPLGDEGEDYHEPDIMTLEQAEQVIEYFEAEKSISKKHNDDYFHLEDREDNPATNSDEENSLRSLLNG